MRRTLAIWLALLAAALSAASVAGARELSRDAARIDGPVHTGGVSMPVRGGVIRPVGAVRGPRTGQDMPDLWGTPIDTFWYGGTVLDGGVPVADEPVASGWTNRKMWTWSVGGFSGTPHSELNMDGWLGVDNTAGAGPYPFRRMRTDSIGACGLNGEWEMFCGVTSYEAWSLCFANTVGTGYGNDWDMHVASPTFAYSGSSPVALEYVYRNDTEDGYDFTFVVLDVYDEVDSGPPPDSNWVSATTLVLYDGSSGSGNDSLDISSELLSYGAIKFRIRIEFVSDGGWSDEDGLVPTACGAFGFDDVSVTGSGVNYFNDFESGTDWEPVISPFPGGPAGDFARADRVENLSPPVSNDPCALVPGWCDVADSVIVFFDPDLVWYPHPECQDNHFQSPPIYVDAHPDYAGFFLHFEYFAKITSCFWGSGDGLHPYWGVRYWPREDCLQWSEWSIDFSWTRNRKYHTDGLPECSKTEIDVSSLIPASAESVQTRLGVLNEGCSCWDCCYENNNTPYFDNVSFGVYGSDDTPVVIVDERWRWQDQFAKDGTLSSNSTADTRTGLQLDGSDPSVFGDTLICYSGSGNTEVSFVFRLTRVGPGVQTSHPFFATWFPGVLDVGGNPTAAWQAVQMDTAETGGSPAQGYWMAAFHEEDATRLANGLSEGTEVLPNDLFTPGTRIEYFLKAEFSGGGSEFLLPDTTGGNYLEFEVLPMMELVGEEIRWPCLVLAGHTLERVDDGRYATELVKEALVANGFVFDEYNRLAAQVCSRSYGTGIGRPSLVGELQGPGATAQQLTAYQAVVVSGGPYRYALGEHDPNVLDGWLAASDSLHPRFLWINGDEALRSLRYGGGIPFMENRLCASYIYDAYFLYSGDDTYCLGGDGWLGGGIECTALGGPEDEHFVLAGNRCPRRFDVVETSGVVGCSGARELAYNETLNGEIYAASVSAIVEESGGSWYRSLIEGYDFTSIRSDASLGAPQCGPDTASAQARADWVQCVLGDFGGLAPAAYCNQASTIGAEKPPDDGASLPVYVTRLEQSYPNPLNPTAIIRFSIGAPGKVRLRIFDVSGRVIRTLVDETRGIGAYTAIWDGKNDHGQMVASGVFFYQLDAPEYRSAKKIVILQ